MAADFTDAADLPGCSRPYGRPPGGGLRPPSGQAKIPKHKPHPLLLPLVFADLGLPSRAQRGREPRCRRVEPWPVLIVLNRGQPRPLGGRPRRSAGAGRGLSAAVPRWRPSRADRRLDEETRSRHARRPRADRRHARRPRRRPVRKESVGQRQFSGPSAGAGAGLVRPEIWREMLSKLRVLRS